MQQKITAVLIDTSAYHSRQCDFSGMTSAMIPTFLKLLETNNIPVLSHQILDNEVRTHINESEILKKVRDLNKSVKKCKGILDSVGLYSDDILDSTKEEKIEELLLDSYNKFQEKFITLPYVEAQEVFEDYFNAIPPFSTSGPKKAEFPDAFILKGLHKYCMDNPESKILVVSNDLDWKRTLSDNEQIVMVDALKDAVSYLWAQLDNKMEFILQVWSEKIPEIMVEVSSAAECEAFAVQGIYEFEDIDITRVHATDMIGNMTPLEITEESILIQASVSLEVDGSVEYLDENRSLWDKEDECYYFTAYSRMLFNNASADAECEIRLNFPADGSMKPVEVANVRITNKWDIEIDVSDANITIEDITNYGEADWRAEQAETLEEYYKH